MKTEKYSHWQLLGSQAVQDIAERLDKAYQKFFNKQGGRPSFKKVKQYRSFTLKQAGWKLLDGNKIQLLGRTYKFVKHREIGDTIKTVTIKRDRVNRLWIAFSVIENIHIPKASTNKIGGFDFGLKTFLMDDEGRPTTSPQYFKQGVSQIATRNRNLAAKEQGSRNRRRAKRQLGMAHEHITNKRRDHHFQLAHGLCDEYGILIFETLHIKAMQMMWGRKVSDLGFAQFIDILQHVAKKRGKTVHFIDRWEPTSQVCSRCQNQQAIALRERVFDCKVCRLILDRDHNAARNIKRVGTSTLGLEAVRRSGECSLA